MASNSPIVLVYVGPPDRSQYLTGIPARDLTEQDLEMLGEVKRKELDDHLDQFHTPLYEEPPERTSQRRLQADAANAAAELAQIQQQSAGVTPGDTSTGDATVHPGEQVKTPAQRGHNAKE